MNLEKLKEQILNCRMCTKEFGYKPNPIFQGTTNSLIMQISQAPSSNVYKSSRPWNDASGKKLIHEWFQISDEDFYNPNNFYISDLSHCYPGKNKKGKGTINHPNNV